MADRDWPNLARQVKERREELGLTQPDIDAAGGPSTAVLRRIENAQSARYQPKTIRQLEQALQVRPGSVRAALAGGTFTPIEGNRPEPSRGEQVSLDGLPPETKQAIRNMVDALRRGERNDKSA